jgi:hypothetical protein
MLVPARHTWHLVLVDAAVLRAAEDYSPRQKVMNL